MRRLISFGHKRRLWQYGRGLCTAHYWLNSLFDDWRMGFLLSGLFCLGYGLVFVANLKTEDDSQPTQSAKTNKYGFVDGWHRALLALALITSAGGFIFGGMTFLVPRYFELEMQNLTTSVAITGLLASIVYAIASFAQIGVVG